MYYQLYSVAMFVLFISLKISFVLISIKLKFVVHLFYCNDMQITLMGSSDWLCCFHTEYIINSFQGRQDVLFEFVSWFQEWGLMLVSFMC